MVIQKTLPQKEVIGWLNKISPKLKARNKPQSYTKRYLTNIIVSIPVMEMRSKTNLMTNFSMALAKTNGENNQANKSSVIKMN